MYETRLGLARHQSPYDKARNGSFAEKNCSLEGQIADIADRIAYNCHDLEDGMRARLISTRQLKSVKIFAEAQNRINAGAIEDYTIRRTRTAKAIIDKLVGNCLEASKKTLAEANPATLEDIYAADANLITLPAESDAELAELEKFLLENFYHHESLLETAEKVKIWLRRLFERLCDESKLMPGYFQRFIPQQGLQRAVCDYIAGMTDRFALKTLETIQVTH
jgi:dGTPase